MSLTLSLLGPFDATRDGATVRFATDRVRALLAYLAVEADRAHRREALAMLLWPDQPESTARQNLRQTLTRLRKALGDTANADATHLVVTRKTLQFNFARASLDVATFEAALSYCHNHEHESLESCLPCIQLLTETLDLYRGDFLQGFSLPESDPFEAWMRQIQETLHRQALDSLDAVIAYHARRGDWAAVRRHAERQIALEPWREEAHAHLMRTLAASGDRAAALAQYERLQQILWAELAVEPGDEIAALRDAIEHDKVEPVAAAPDAADLLHNFPTYYTSFVGRQSEWQRILDHLTAANCRLLTLLGPGGIGKTRLSVEAAAQVAETGLFSDGVVFVSLAQADSVHTLTASLLDSLGLDPSQRRAPLERLLDFLRDKRLLLVLDNFEQLLVSEVLQPFDPASPSTDLPEDGADVVLQMLEAAPHVKCLVTSRQTLSLQAEWVLPLDGLDYPQTLTDEPASDNPAPDATFLVYAAPQLFIQRVAQATGRDLPDDAATRAAVSRICRLVEGAPLALEMAAAWARRFPLAQIGDQIATTLDFLQTPLRDVPSRHRTIRAVFEGSWSLLTPGRQRLLAHASIFVGGWTLHAAQQILQHPSDASDDVHSAPDDLIDKSLLRRVQTEHVERFEMHELVKRYADEKLAEGDFVDTRAVRTRHSRYFLDFIAARQTTLLAHQHGVLGSVFDEVRRDIDNLRAAWRCAVDDLDFAPLHEALLGLARYHTLAGLPHEGDALMSRGVDRLTPLANEPDSRAAQRLLSRLLANRSMFRNAQARYDEAIADAALAIALGEATATARPQAKSALNWGDALWYKGQLDESRPKYLQALAVARRGNFARIEIDVLRALGALAVRFGDYAESQAYCDQALSLARKIGDRVRESQALHGLGTIARNRSRFAEAQKHLEQALALHHELGDKRGKSTVLNSLGDVHLYRGSYLRSRAVFAASLDLHRASGNRRGQSIALTNLGIVHRDLGDFATAQSHFEAALRLTREIDFRRGEGWTLLCWGLLHHMQGVDDEVLVQSRAAFDIFEALGDPIGRGFACTHMGRAYSGLAQWHDAANAFGDAIAIRRTLAQPHMLMESLAGLAQVRLAQGDVNEARELVEEILAHVALGPTGGGSLGGTEEPLQIRWTCVEVLRTAGDPRADTVAAGARERLHASAERIEEASLRESFLQNVPVNREIGEMVMV